MAGVATWAAEVEQVLARAQSLFANPNPSGGAAAEQSSTTISAAARQTLTNAAASATDSGRTANGYQYVGSMLATQGETLATDDAALRRLLDRAAATDRQGLQRATAVLNAAAADITTHSPAANTPAGERALIQALRDRVAQQRQLLQDTNLAIAEQTAPLKLLYHPEGIVPYEPLPEDPPRAGIICYIGTKDGDPAQICAGSDVAEIAYFDDDGTYIIEDAQTGEVRLERPVGPQHDDPTSCWLPPGGTDRSSCGPGTTHWSYPQPDGTIVSEQLNPDTGEIEITFQTPLGPLTA